MRVGLSTNSIMSCQPLSPAFGQNSSQSKTSAQYEKEIASLKKECKAANEKYWIACQIAANQTNQFDQFIKSPKK